MQLEIEKRIFDHFLRMPFTKCCLGVKLILLFQTQFPLHIIIYLVSFMDCDIGIISKSRFTAKHNKKAKNLKKCITFKNEQKCVFQFPKPFRNLTLSIPILHLIKKYR